MDKSGANKAAIDGINHDRELPVEVRQIKHLNNIVEQDHRAIKRVTKPMLNFKSFRSARKVLTGIELMHMIRKGQMSEENQMFFCRTILRTGKINPPTLKGWHACSLEICGFVVNATEPLSTVPNRRCMRIRL
jgi:hypothetical protein